MRPPLVTSLTCSFRVCLIYMCFFLFFFVFLVLFVLGTGLAVCTVAYEAQTEDELQLAVGDEVQLLEKVCVVTPCTADVCGHSLHYRCVVTRYKRVRLYRCCSCEPPVDSVIVLRRHHNSHISCIIHLLPQVLQHRHTYHT
jgi:hypothetical protein